MGPALVAAAVLIVHVAELSGAGLPRALVTLTQASSTQSRRTGDTGEARFRAEPGPAQVALDPRLPAGWVLEGTSTLEVRLGTGLSQASFKVRARRSLSGTVFLDLDGDGRPGPGEAFWPGLPIGAGEREGIADARGAFTLEDLPAGMVVLQISDLLAVPAGIEGKVEVTLPGGPGQVRRDLPLRVERFRDDELQGDRMRIVPQPPASRAIADWVGGKALREGEVTAIERLSAMTNLDPAFRLLLVATPEKPGSAEALLHAVQAGLALQRYLMGPGLVPRGRLAFLLGAGNLARTGELTLMLGRVEGGVR